jgi:predicted dehydrogenase
MPHKYRAAVIGCGRIGLTMELDPRRVKPATHAAAFASSPLAELYALVDTNPAQLDRARSLYPEVRTYGDVRTMLETCHPDIVAVAAPADQHRPIVEICARYRVPAIICEKPIALSLKDGEAIVRACSDAGSLLFVNHMRRFDPLLRKVAEKVRAGVLGTLCQGTCYYSAGLFNTGTHLVDLLALLVGREVEWVKAILEPRFTAPAGDLNVNGWLMWQGGLPIALQALEVKNYAVFEIHLFGSEQALVIDRFGFSVEWAPVVECNDFQGYRELDRLHRTREGEPRSFLTHTVEHVTECLEGRAAPFSSGEDGLRALMILTSLQESANRQGERVSVSKEEVVHE